MEDVETAICALLGESRVEDPEKAETLKTMLSELRSSDEGFVHLIEMFPQFQVDAPRWFTFHIVASLIKTRWEDVVQSYFDLIIDFLFTKSVDGTIYQLLTEKSAAELAKTQSIFIASAFPTVIEDFLQFFEDKELITKLRFLEALCRDIAHPKPPAILYNPVKFAPYIDSFTQLIFTGCSEAYPVAYSALSYFTCWCGNAWAENSECCQIVLTGFAMPNICPLAANVVASLLTFSTEEQEDAFIDTFDVVNQIETNLSGENDEIVYLSFSKLVQAAGNAMLSSESCETFVQYALIILKCSDEAVSSSIVSFLDNYASLTKDVAPIFEAAMERLGESITASPIIITDLQRRLTKLCYTALCSNEQLEDALVGMLDESLSENIAITSAILIIIYDASELGFKFKQINQMFVFFAELISIQPPVAAEMYPAVIGFFRLALIANPGESTQEVLESLVTFVASDHENPEINRRMTNLLTRYIRKYATVIAVTDELISTALECGTREATNVAAILVNLYNEENRVQIFHSVFSMLYEAATSSEATQENIINVLTFLSVARCPYNEELLGQVQEMITGSLDALINLPEELGLLIRSVGSIGAHGLPLLLQIIDGQTERVEVVRAAAEAGSRIRIAVKHDAQSNPEIGLVNKSPEMVQLTQVVGDSFISLLDNFWVSAPIDEEVAPYIRMGISCVRFIADAISCITEEEARVELEMMVADFLVNYFENDTVVSTVMDFCAKVSAYYAVEMCRRFTAFSLCCLYSPHYDVNAPQWLRTTKDIICFHRCLVSKIEGDITRELGQAVVNMRGDPASVGEYIAALKTLNQNPNSREALEAALEFYSDLTI